MEGSRSRGGADGERRALRKTDVQERFVQRDGDADRAEPLDNVPSRGFLVRGAGFSHERDEPVEQRTRLVQPNRVSRGRFQGFVCEHRKCVGHEKGLPH